MDVAFEQYKKDFILNKCCVIIPTYNNASTLEDVILSINQYTDHIIVVNDGSTDETASILNKLAHIQTVHLPINKGKGVALQTAFKYAYEHGYQYAITIDSDGQHFAKDIPMFLEKLKECPNSIIIGARNMDQASVPGKSSFGHKFSNFWFWFETGISLPDTQSGFRLYPLKSLRDMTWYTTKYEFEIEVIVRAAWKGIGIDAVPISVYYAPKETRISHFRPFKDFSRVSVLNFFLVVLTLIYYKPLRILSFFKKKNLINFINTQLLNPDESDWRKILSISFGVFMGIFPVWGYQLIIGIALAHFFKLNKALFVVAAHISVPPMIPLIIFLSYHFGALLLNNPVAAGPFSKSFSLDSIKDNMLQYLVGSIALSIVAAIMFGLVAFLVLKLFPLKKKQLYTFNY